VRIGIDATALPSQLYGAGNYIARLIRVLPRIDETNEYVVFVKPEHATLFPRLENLRIIQAALASRILRLAWEQAILPILARRSRLDVLHSPHYTMPLLKPCPTVVTFHDMTLFLYPELHQLYKKIFFQTAIRLSARRADAIIAGSESARRDALLVLGLDANQVTAIGLGVSEAFREECDAAAMERVRQNYHLPARFILSVSVLERKICFALVRIHC
jgi:hypothetical protein